MKFWPKNRYKLCAGVEGNYIKKFLFNVTLCSVDDSNGVTDVKSLTQNIKLKKNVLHKNNVNNFFFLHFAIVFFQKFHGTLTYLLSAVKVYTYVIDYCKCT